MTQVLISLVNIARLRRDPSVLPASIALLFLMSVAYAAGSALQSWLLYGSDRLLARTAADLGLTFAIFWFVLAVTRRLHRYRQTMNAVLGTSVLLTPVLMLLIALQQPAAVYYPVKLVAWAGSIAVIVWYTLIIGHILRSAIEIGFVTSIAIAITTVIAANAVLGKLFPMAA
ncbi:MAG: hypothetical protein OEW16_09830 [Gammaproteobacteria bacterium]|nr:hypothetical protein [Gammaproteobacteria bacterium]